MQKTFFQKHLATTIFLIVIIIFAWWIGPHHELMTLMIRQAGLFGPLVALLLYCILSLTPIPSDPLTIATALLYGPLVGFLISWLGNTAAAITEYVLAKRIEDSLNFNQQSLPHWLRNLPIHSIWFLIGARFVPAVGGKAVAILAGLHQVSWWRFIWTTAVANIFGSLLWVLGGVGFLGLFS